MRIALIVVLAATAVPPAGAQQNVPPPPPALGISLGIAGGIAVPVREFARTNAAGYTVGAFADFGAIEQPVSVRLEASMQEFPRRSEAPADAPNVRIAIGGATLVARSPQGSSAVTVLAGLAAYRATDLKIRPGVSAGLGLELPVRTFTSVAETRVNFILGGEKPLTTIPITLGFRF